MYNLTNRIVSLVSTRGDAFALSYLKDARVAYLSYLAGNPMRKSTVKLTSDGIPCILGALIPYIRMATPPADMLRMLNTILWASRALNLGRLPDISPITGPPIRELPQDFGKYAVDFWKELGYRPSKTFYPNRLKFSKFHLTTKSGPNGHALFSSLWDFKLLDDPLRKSLVTLGGPLLEEKMSTIDRILKYVPSLIHYPYKEYKFKTSRLRKLSYFPDKENKVRVIAVGDYFTQTVLRS
jgi:hypothetical protein